MSSYSFRKMILRNSVRPNLFSVRMAAGLVPVAVLAVMCLWSNPAAADFRLCNNTSSRVGIARGYKDAEGLTTEDWRNVGTRGGETVLLCTPAAPYYYIYP